MTQTVSFDQLTLSGIAHRCSQETHRFFRREDYDPRYCYELFRHAIVDSDQQAHQCLYTQYLPLVAGWVERHPSFRQAGEDTDYFVNRAFEKLWRAIPAAKFTRFTDLKALLAYLKMCTHSVIIDFTRSQEVPVDDEGSDGLALLGTASDMNVEKAVVSELGRGEFWRLVQERLNNNSEYVVIYGSFVMGMKPAEMLTEYPDIFTDVKDVYRTKQNVLERLRRDSELAELLAAAA